MTLYQLVERAGPAIAFLLLILMIVATIRLRVEPAAQRFSLWEIAIGIAPLDRSELSAAGQRRLDLVSQLRRVVLLCAMASVAARWLNPGVS